MSEIGTFDLSQWMQATNQLSKIFSTCARKNYAAVILDSFGNLCSFGYNGKLLGNLSCSKGDCPRAYSDSRPGEDYSNCHAPHAEVMAILNCSQETRAGGTIIVNGPPCDMCARLISVSGLSRLVYSPDPQYTRWSEIRQTIESNGVKVVAFSMALAEEPETPTKP